MFTFTLSSSVLVRVYLCSVLFTIGATTKDNGPKSRKQGMSGNIAPARNVFFLLLYTFSPSAIVLIASFLMNSGSNFKSKFRFSVSQFEYWTS